MGTSSRHQVWWDVWKRKLSEKKEKTTTIRQEPSISSLPASSALRQWEKSSESPRYWHNNDVDTQHTKLKDDEVCQNNITTNQTWLKFVVNLMRISSLVRFPSSKVTISEEIEKISYTAPTKATWDLTNQVTHLIWTAVSLMMNKEWTLARQLLTDT